MSKEYKILYQLKRIKNNPNLPLLEKGEIFLLAKEFFGMHTDRITKLSGCQIATVYNGIKLAHLPEHLKDYVTTNQIPSTTLLSLVRETKKSPTFHRDIEAKVKVTIKEIEDQKELSKRITLYSKIDDLKKLIAKENSLKAKQLAKALVLIESNDDMSKIVGELI
jgi:uncharacterized protein YllA (UPF0747 family)